MCHQSLMSFDVQDKTVRRSSCVGLHSLNSGVYFQMSGSCREECILLPGDHLLQFDACAQVYSSWWWPFIAVFTRTGKYSRKECDKGRFKIVRCGWEKSELLRRSRKLLLYKLESSTLSQIFKTISTCFWQV